MFDKLAPTPITEKKYRYLMIVAMVWMFTGAWVDSSAHTFLLDEIETFFTPWHALLYTGYGFVVISAVYVKNKMKDYKFDFNKYFKLFNIFSRISNRPSAPPSIFVFGFIFSSLQKKGYM